MTPDKVDDHPACLACTGMCCYRFHIRLPVDDAGRVNVGEMKRSLKEGFELSDEEAARQADFMLGNFERMRRKPHFLDDRSDCGKGFKYTNYVCKCLKFDKKTGRCTAYDERPDTCSRFSCGAVTDDRAPTWLDCDIAMRSLKATGEWPEWKDRMPTTLPLPVPEKKAICPDKVAEVLAVDDDRLHKALSTMSEREHEELLTELNESGHTDLVDRIETLKACKMPTKRHEEEV